MKDAGVDLFCGGWEAGEKLVVGASWCKNVTYYGGHFVLVDVEYHWSK